MPNRRDKGEAALLVVIVLPHVLRVLPVVPVVVHIAAGFWSLWIELPLAGPADDGCDGEAEGAEVAAAVQASSTSAQLLRGFWSIKTPEQNMFWWLSIGQSKRSIIKSASMDGSGLEGRCRPAVVAGAATVLAVAVRADLLVPRTCGATPMHRHRFLSASSSFEPFINFSTTDSAEGGNASLRFKKETRNSRKGQGEVSPNSPSIHLSI